MWRLAGTYILACLLCLACEDPPAPPELEPPRPRAEDDIVRIAGASAGTPLLKHLSTEFMARSGGQPINVEVPIGSEGALQALSAGVIDAAIVALPADASRPPGGVEVALSPVGVVAGSRVPTRSLTMEALIETVRGESGPWSNQQSRMVLLRPRQDPAQALLSGLSAGLGAAVDDALDRHRWPVYPEDEALRDALKRTPGAIAISDLGTLRQLGAPVWFLSPGPGGQQRWGELIIWLVPRRGASKRLYAFLDYVKGVEARRTVIDLGYGRR
ncbi:MAG: substrate-binding domain-containing protein [Bradymonadia bacterium]